MCQPLNDYMLLPVAGCSHLCLWLRPVPVNRFNWTDGKLNSSNLIELSGQVTEKFDEEFRILYAQSLPLNTRGPPAVRNSGLCDQLAITNLITSSPHVAGAGPVEPVCLTSTPTRKPSSLALQPPCEPVSPGRQKTSSVSDSSTIGEDGAERRHLQEEVVAGSAVQRFPAGQLDEEEPAFPSIVHCHASTQTSRSVTDGDTQTDLELATQTSRAPSQNAPPSPASGDTLKECFHKLSEERQYHYSNIRAKLEHIVTALSHRRELVDVTNVTHGAHSRQRVHKGCEQDPNPRPLVESAGMGTWPRARCVH